MIQRSSIIYSIASIVFVVRQFPQVVSICSSSKSNFSYRCNSTFPKDRINVGELELFCSSNSNRNVVHHQPFYSIIQRFRVENCSMNTLYLDRYTMWNYLESLSIINGKLTRISGALFNKSTSMPSILYSVKTLNLSRNSLVLLNGKFSFYFPSLEILDLSFNRLETIRKRSFSNFRHLKELNLENNFLRKLSWNFFPSESLISMNLNENQWHCNCDNVEFLSQSRPSTWCRTPSIYQNRTIDEIVQQCFLYRRANYFLTISTDRSENLLCLPSLTIEENRLDEFDPKINVTSIFDIRLNRSLSVDSFPHEILICFDDDRTAPIWIRRVVSLKSSKRRTKPVDSKLSTFSQFLFRLSKFVLPKSLKNSPKSILIVWLVLLSISLSILVFLIVCLYRNQKSRKHLEIRPNSTHEFLVRPSFIEPSPLRYAKIKRISPSRPANGNYRTGEFRTLIKLKNSPN